MRRTSTGLCGVALVLALLAGCGGSDAPSDDVPALGDALERVDEAIVDGRYDVARSELEELVAATTDAREAGDLEGPEADRIIAAATEVTSALPTEPADPADEPTPTETPAETPAESPTESPVDSPSESDGEDTDEESDEAEKEEERVEKEQEKVDKELEKESSENGNSEEKGSGKDKDD